LDEAEEYIDFMAKYKDWISIKRLGIREGTKPEEVVNHMAAIRSTIDYKSYPMLGIKTKILDDCAAKMCLGSKKNYQSLADALVKMNGSEAKSAIADSCPKELSSIAEVYLLSKVMTTIGFDSGITPEKLKKIYPYLKLPKAPGMGKGKKKAEED
jgi:hypothetical protein